MDPPPLPPHPSDPTTTATAAAAAIQTHPGSADSSPRTRTADMWDEPLQQVPNSRLRLMCSYGGHIIPRPHDKSLCYLGGETRLVVVDRNSSLTDLTARLSRTLLNGRHFTLKYQLPSEDLDSLVSVATDEDLDNMIEEYDRTNSASPLKPSRLRLFLFLAKPETAASMGSLLDDAKSETWFVDALNSVQLLPRGLSDSAALDCLLGLDGAMSNDWCNDVEAHAVQKVESSSSSSSPSMSNLPPIRVRVEESGARFYDQLKSGLEEQFSLSGISHNVQRQDGANSIATVVTVNSLAVPGENANRVFSDYERSDRGSAFGFRKPPLQPVQRKLNDGSNLASPDSKHSGGFNLSSPDSVASDSSIASAVSLSKSNFNHDPAQLAHRENRAPPSPVDPKMEMSDHSRPQLQMHQVQESGYILPPHLDQHHLLQHQQQQQFVHATAHYIPHSATGSVPMSSYHAMYAPPSESQILHPADHQYPMYLVPISQNQPYNMPVQANMPMAGPGASSSSVATTTPNPPPLYPTMAAGPIQPEMCASVYKTAVTEAPRQIQVPSDQFQQQYVGFPQMHHHPSQSIAVTPAAAAGFAYDYAHTLQDQVYSTQHPTAATLPTQYQAMASAPRAMTSEASTQLLTTDGIKQQTRTSTPQ